MTLTINTHSANALAQKQKSQAPKATQEETKLLPNIVAPKIAFQGGLDDDFNIDISSTNASDVDGIDLSEFGLEETPQQLPPDAKQPPKMSASLEDEYGLPTGNDRPAAPPANNDYGLGALDQDLDIGQEVAYGSKTSSGLPDDFGLSDLEATVPEQTLINPLDVQEERKQLHRATHETKSFIDKLPIPEGLKEKFTPAAIMASIESLKGKFSKDSENNNGSGGNNMLDKITENLPGPLKDKRVLIGGGVGIPLAAILMTTAANVMGPKKVEENFDPPAPRTEMVDPNVQTEAAPPMPEATTVPTDINPSALPAPPPPTVPQTQVPPVPVAPAPQTQVPPAPMAPAPTVPQAPSGQDIFDDPSYTAPTIAPTQPSNLGQPVQQEQQQPAPPPQSDIFNTSP